MKCFLTLRLYLKEHDACLEFAEGDEKSLKADYPDFIGFNYYSATTCEASLGEEDAFPSDQQTAKDEAGMYRACKNPNLGS